MVDGMGSFFVGSPDFLEMTRLTCTRSPPSDNDKIDLGERILDTLVANFVEPRATDRTPRRWT